MAPQLVLVTPIVGTEDLVGPLQQALETESIASVLLRLAAADERSLVNRIKTFVPIVQARHAALIVDFAEDRAATRDIATIAARGGADGIHVTHSAELKRLRERYRDERIVGAGGLFTRHDAMAAGEAGADYVMFGESGEDDRMPSFDETFERAAWWAEIFETPCIAVASTLHDCAELAATGAEFVALTPDAWMGDPARSVRAALAALATIEGRAA